MTRSVKTPQSPNRVPARGRGGRHVPLCLGEFQSAGATPGGRPSTCLRVVEWKAHPISRGQQRPRDHENVRKTLLASFLLRQEKNLKRLLALAPVAAHFPTRSRVTN